MSGPFKVNFQGGEPCEGALEAVQLMALGAVCMAEGQDLLQALHATPPIAPVEPLHLRAPTRQAEKDVATLTAEFALSGFELVQMADGSFVASRWGMLRPLATIEAARAWLSRVSGRAVG